jgi:hypothetical protein
MARPKNREHITSRRPAYAVAADGSRRPIDAEAIVLNLGVGEIVIGLTVDSAFLEQRVRLHTPNDRVLVVGPGDARSIYLGLGGDGSSRRSKT